MIRLCFSNLSLLKYQIRSSKRRVMDEAVNKLSPSSTNAFAKPIIISCKVNESSLCRVSEDNKENITGANSNNQGQVQLKLIKQDLQHTEKAKRELEIKYKTLKVNSKKWLKEKDVEIHKMSNEVSLKAKEINQLKKEVARLKNVLDKRNQRHDQHSVKALKLEIQKLSRYNALLQKRVNQYK